MPPPCARCGSRPGRRRCRGSPAARPRRGRRSGATPPARTSARAAAIPLLVAGVISWKVRNTVESEGTEPKRSSWSRRCSMSAQLSPPPASMSDAVHEHLAPVVQRKALTALVGCEPRAHRRVPSGRQKPQERAVRRGPRRRSPPGSTTTRRVLVPFTLEVPFWSGSLLRRHQQFPLLGGHFRGRAAVQLMRRRE